MLKNNMIIQMDAKQQIKKKPGLITIVYSKENSKRIVISKQITELLELESSVKVAIYGNALILSKESPQIDASFQLKEQGRKKIIYSSELVNEIRLCLPLEFDNCVSRTLYGAHFERINGEELLVVYEKEFEFEDPQLEYEEE